MYKETIGEKISDFFVDHIVLAVLGIILIPIILFCICSCFQLNTGDKQYTGYIYSAEDGIAETIGHLRFSENAGYDEQPSFCVDKKDGAQVKELAGSGKKVRVTVPAGFTVAFPWVCGIPAQIEEIDGSI